VLAKVDRLMTLDVSMSIVMRRFEELNAKKIYDEDMFVVSFDHLGCGHTVADSEALKRAREYAKKYNLKHFYDVGRNGICHQILIEEGFVQPGALVCGTDSHTPSSGALGALACGVTQSEAAVILATGQNWFRVPETIKVNLVGKMPFGVYGKDVALKILSILRCDEDANYRSIEIVGPGVSSLEISDRITICNMMAETGAKFCVVPGDKKTIEYLEGISKSPYTIIESDPDAKFEKVIEIDLAELEPLVSVPHAMDSVCAVKEIDREVNRVFIGSCTNGRLEDFAQAAQILMGRKISDDVVAIAVPASRKILLEAIAAGYIQTLVSAGFVVESPSCGACMGLHSGVLAAGDVAVSTTNRNFRGRMGSTEASVYLASAATAAAAALEGKLVDPRKYL